MSHDDHNLDALLDLWKVPQLQSDLTGRIMARARGEEAGLDGLLERAARDPNATLGRDLTGDILAAARAEEQALDKLLAVGDRIPAMGRDLAKPVVARVRREKMTRRLMVWGSIVAAAAAIAIVALIGFRPGAEPSQPIVEQPTKQTVQVVKLSPQDQFLADNLQLVRDMPVYMHWDTIRAMEQLENEETGVRHRL